MISVIMSVFNNEKTVKDAVFSILNGEFKELEFIVVDDCSTDNTLAILNEIQENDSRLKILKNDRNMGITYSLNYAVENAKFDILARQDGDDVSHFDRLKIQYNYLISKPNVDFVGSAVNLVENGNIYGKYMFDNEITKKNIFKGNPINHPTLVIKKEALEKVGGYRTIKKVERCEDYDLMFRLLAKGFKGENIPLSLVDYFESTKKYKHTIKTRLNECYVIRHGGNLLKRPFKGFFSSIKNFMKIFVPNCLYAKIHKAKYSKTSE